MAWVLGAVNEGADILVGCMRVVKRFGLVICEELLWEIGVGRFFFDIARWA